MKIQLTFCSKPPHDHLNFEKILKAPTLLLHRVAYKYPPRLPLTSSAIPLSSSSSSPPNKPPQKGGEFEREREREWKARVRVRVSSSPPSRGAMAAPPPSSPSPPPAAAAAATQQTQPHPQTPFYELVKGNSGIEKVLLRGTRGFSAEVSDPFSPANPNPTLASVPLSLLPFVVCVCGGGGDSCGFGRHYRRSGGNSADPRPGAWGEFVRGLVVFRRAISSRWGWFGGAFARSAARGLVI